MPRFRISKAVTAPVVWVDAWSKYVFLIEISGAVNSLSCVLFYA